MSKFKKVVGISALAITVAMNSMTMGVVCAEDGDLGAVVDNQLTDNDVNDNPSADNNDDNQNTDADDTLSEVTAYITDNMDNNSDGNAITLVIDGSDEKTREFKIVVDGAYFNNSYYPDNYAIYDGEDLTDWCNGTLPSGLTLNKYTGNTGASYGRVKINGTTSAVGSQNVVITIPADRLKTKPEYKITPEGITVTFTVNVNGISTTYTAPAEAVVFEESTPAPVEVVSTVDNDYNMFCSETAKTILKAEENSVVEISTDVWISFNDKVSDALDARPDVALNLKFLYEGQKYLTSISAGTIRETTVEIIAADVDDPDAEAVVLDPALNEDGNHYYGFLYISSLYGYAKAE